MISYTRFRVNLQIKWVVSLREMEEDTNIREVEYLVLEVGRNWNYITKPNNTWGHQNVKEVKGIPRSSKGPLFLTP